MSPICTAAKGVLELAIAAVALVTQPGALRAPVDLFRLPHIGAAGAEPERGEAHGLEGDVAGQDHQVGPGDLLPVLLLDRPEQPAGLVEVAVVGPAVEGGEALHAGAGAAAAVLDAVGAGGVPGHADEQTPVVAPVGRPPGLRVGHQGAQIGLQGREVEGGKGVGVAKASAHGVPLGGVLVEDLEVELVGPPVTVRAGAGRRSVERALAFSFHGYVLLCARRRLGVAGSAGGRGGA
jgi:hypothetical protein